MLPAVLQPEIPLSRLQCLETLLKKATRKTGHFNLADGWTFELGIDSADGSLRGVAPLHVIIATDVE